MQGTKLTIFFLSLKLCKQRNVTSYIEKKKLYKNKFRPQLWSSGHCMSYRKHE